jgi:hypothetical protein
MQNTVKTPLTISRPLSKGKGKARGEVLVKVKIKLFYVP